MGLSSRVYPVQRFRRCLECGRVFDLLVELDVTEWHFGHDCEG